LAAARIRSVAAFTNRTGSGRSFTMNVDSVFLTSRGISVPLSFAAVASTPSALRLRKRVSSYDFVATTIAGLPAFRAAAVKRVKFSKRTFSSE